MQWILLCLASFSASKYVSFSSYFCWIANTSPPLKRYVPTLLFECKVKPATARRRDNGANSHYSWCSQLNSQFHGLLHLQTQSPPYHRQTNWFIDARGGAVVYSRCAVEWNFVLQLVRYSQPVRRSSTHAISLPASRCAIIYYKIYQYIGTYTYTKVTLNLFKNIY